MRWFFSVCICDKRDKPMNSNTTPVMFTNSTNTEAEAGRSGSELNSQNVSNSSSESSRRNYIQSMSERASNLRVFTVSDLKSATKNFSRTFMGHKEWVTEVNFLGFAEHPNLVKLVGYCADDDERGIQRLLIIFRDFKSSNILLDEQWNAKLSDFGLARLGPPEGFTHVSTASSALAFELLYWTELSQSCNKYTKVLVPIDKNHNAVVLFRTFCVFLALNKYDNNAHQIVGTMGYAAPEYVQTGRLTSKTDVWSYGVFLYELITGRVPIDRNRPKSEQKLLEWVRPYLSDTKKFQLILDPKLKGKSHIKSAYKLSNVANRCLVRNPKNRPKMSNILEMVSQIAEAWTETGNSQAPLETLTSSKTPKPAEPWNDRKTIDSRHRNNGWFSCLSAPKLLRTC
ncbi:putative serine/threonine-protein kinase PBL19, partial [Cucurbita argyrosperma subsp. argyrosperma]